MDRKLLLYEVHRSTHHFNNRLFMLLFKRYGALFSCTLYMVFLISRTWTTAMGVECRILSTLGQRHMCLNCDFFQLVVQFADISHLSVSQSSNNKIRCIPNLRSIDFVGTPVLHQSNPIVHLVRLSH